VLEIAGRHGLIVIEDAAQAIGAESRGRRAGSIGQYGCFSFFPSKNLGRRRRRGNDRHQRCSTRRKLKRLRAHGSKPKYQHKIIGGNFRLDALQAAIVLAKLPHLDEWTEARQSNAKTYHRLFEEAGLATRKGSPQVGLPRVVTERHVFNQYVISGSRRAELQGSAAAEGDRD